MKSKIITYAAASSLLIIALSFAYYLVWHLPNKEKAEQELEREKFETQIRYENQQEASKQSSLESCLANAYDTYDGNWNLNCPKHALDGKATDCSLPRSISGPIEEDYKTDQELCVKKYK